MSRYSLKHVADDCLERDLDSLRARGDGGRPDKSMGGDRQSSQHAVQHVELLQAVDVRQRPVTPLRRQSPVSRCDCASDASARSMRLVSGGCTSRDEAMRGGEEVAKRPPPGIAEVEPPQEEDR